MLNIKKAITISGILLNLIPTIDAPATGVATVGWDTTDKAGEHILYVVVDEEEKIVEMVLNYDDELLEFRGLERKEAKTEFSHSKGKLQIAVASDASLPKGELIFLFDSARQIWTVAKLS